jgi:predicted ribosome quality control (RQC) complex YloA/Tae2 family protein
VHSDLENSCIAIIKNSLEEGAIPPGTLAQAGVMAVATSRAWDAKQGTSSTFVGIDFG